MAPAASQAATGPSQQTFLAAGFTSFTTGDGLDAPGSNDWTCQPSLAQPRPVVLVHGTFANRYDNWAYLSPALKRAGFCVYALDYSATNSIPMYGTGSIRASGDELAAFVDRVLAQTGADQVDIVGHSQGGLMPRAYLKYSPGAAAKVKNLITIGATHKGTTLSGLANLANAFKLMSGVRASLGQAAVDQVTGSPFLRDLNRGGLTVAGVDYTTIVTKYDEIATPYTTGQITAADNPAGARVTNIVLQNGCPTNFADHFSMVYSARTAYFVTRALGGPTSKTAVCDFQLPVF